jgi:hypothetical protein
MVWIDVLWMEWLCWGVEGSVLGTISADYSVLRLALRNLYHDVFVQSIQVEVCGVGLPY